MSRNTSHGSGYSNYSGSSNGQFDVAVSPNSEGINDFDLNVNPTDVGTYFTNENVNDNGYQVGGVVDTTNYITAGNGNDTGYQVDESGFQYQLYNFVATGNLGQGPYWQLKPGYTPDTNYPATIPAQQSSEVPRSTNESANRHVCLERFCQAPPFKRKADLERHYLHRHRDSSQKEAFPCDWKRCQRFKEPFYRRDHCREHYRDYHNEDLEPRGSKKQSNEWWKSRNVDTKWWRCAKCLNRIPIDSKGFECSKCKTTCETERRKLRGYK
ncbi:uncharacterized protein F4822DRAFT_427862 [Hypoxylon trugodes]|uniref:uncharacterized protein n=1 Tax=Hypoxylon trugodes TaxID=326681 RepID=UPI002194AEB2|nr:uncharacterized protein F4822DRAFT_427862 [Hypoxylon trugodes]KAI1389513.1 hypothetical protein F4822DRAFT_427862 [Hypoxylon trugodes]